MTSNAFSSFSAIIVIIHTHVRTYIAMKLFAFVYIHISKYD